MRRVVAVLGGLVVGFLMAGALAPPVVMMMPAAYRTSGVVWTVSGIAIAVSVYACWRLAGSSSGSR